MPVLVVLDRRSGTENQRLYGYNKIMWKEKWFKRQASILKKEFGLNADNSVLHVALIALDNGVRWATNRYSTTEYPIINIAENTGPLSVVSGYIHTDIGEKKIILDINELKLLNGETSPDTIRIVVDYGSDIPPSINPVLSLKQWLEGFAIEEAIHWLQDSNTDGLVRLPAKNKLLEWNQHNGIQYLLQPHEYEVLQLLGIFYLERYGENPYQKLMDFIQNQRN